MENKNLPLKKLISGFLLLTCIGCLFICSGFLLLSLKGNLAEKIKNAVNGINSTNTHIEIPQNNQQSKSQDITPIPTKTSIQESSIPTKGNDYLEITKTAEIQISTSGIYAVDWDPRGNWIGASTFHGEIYLIDTQNYKVKHLLSAKEIIKLNELYEGVEDIIDYLDEIQVSLKFSHKENLLFLIIDYTESVYVISLDTLKIVDEYTFYDPYRTDYFGEKHKISSDLKIGYGLSTGRDRADCLYRIEEFKDFDSVKLNELIHNSIIRPQDTGSLNYYRCYLSPDKSSVISISQYGQIDLWDTKTMKLKFNLNPKCDQDFGTIYSTSGAFSTDGKYFYGCQCDDGGIWDVDQGKVVRKYSFCDENPVFSQNGQFLLTGITSIFFRDIWQQRRILNNQTQILNTDEFIDRYYSWFPTEDGEYKEGFYVTDIDFSPNNKYFAIGREDGSILIYEILSNGQ